MTLSGTFILIWLIGVIATVLVAKHRRRNVLGFFLLALLIWPVALIMAAAGGNYGRRCDACQEVVQDKASVCPHCRTSLVPAGA